MRKTAVGLELAHLCPPESKLVHQFLAAIRLSFQDQSSDMLKRIASPPQLQSQSEISSQLHQMW